MDEGESAEEHPFYTHAVKYWSEIPPTVDGMLGGFGFVSNTDIQGSKAFLKNLFKLKDAPGTGRAIDCGAGIGRITKHLLLQFFDKVDLVEQNPKFLEEAKTFIGPNKKVENYFSTGLQHFRPPENTYDVIWCQWVLGHLTDYHFVEFFRACSEGLKPNGVIVVKENLTSSDKVEIDEQDSSVTRPIGVLKSLFEQAGLTSIREAKQNNFPPGLYQVRMFALRPAPANIL
ncbi:N-terminal Xaa-Pro-Lys N-methyltransferase 1 [Anabrus simplex]|uniref:N-terminal Xaa-Pro-Lys N-methyltransferase 1 n=1 Tax=Anabrus simplex TaxID=316456 RepID=UPI0034DDC66A